MVEDSIPTFQTFCAHHDVATLAADQQYIRQYEDIVKLYSSFAARNSPVRSKGPMSAPMTIRWRSAGVHAIKSIASSEAVAADGGRQLNVIMPMILENLYSENEDYFLLLQQRLHTLERPNKDAIHRRKMSTATVQTVDTDGEANQAAVSGSTDDADRLAEEEVGVLALQSLKQIFVANNRAQVRIATAALLRFVSSKVPPKRPATADSRSDGTGTWASAVLELVTRWTPVQDRFVILVTAMETLVRSPVAEDNLEQQLVLVSLIGWLLSSSINMIGLSIMDVLLGLIQHILLLLQLGGKGSNVLPHHQQTDAIDLFQETKDLIEPPSSTETLEKTRITDVSSPSETRQELLVRLRKCIGDLATHVYYSDQISDMITAILLRLKPSLASGIATATAAIEHPAAAAQAISNSVNLREDPQTDEFFSFGTARVTALNAIKEILIVANKKGSVSGAAAIGRNRVGVQVWDATQWLLRDEDRRVRRAYVEALLTWLKLEMSKDDLRVMEDKRITSKGQIKSYNEPDDSTRFNRRAVSNASQKNKTPKPARSTFLQLIHLAVYNNALETPESNSDILLLHLLLANLVDKLGVNAVKNGLPMILRLQEDINIDEIISTPLAKLNIGSLVHGYFWIVSEKFEFDTTMVGYEIHSEISRRRKLGLWLDTVQSPPIPLDQIISQATVSPLSKKPLLPPLEKQSLKPFDSCPAMVDRIAASYASSATSSQLSPPTSPGRKLSTPILSSPASASTDDTLPPTFKEAMLSKWTKETCISVVEKESTRTASVSGSRTGTNGSLYGYLAVNGHTARSGSPAAAHSPVRSISNQRSKERGPLEKSLNSHPPLYQERLRRASAQDIRSPTPASSSDNGPMLRVDDLKRVLAGGALASVFSRKPSGASVRESSPLRASTRHQDVPETPRRASIPSTDSDSAISAEGFESASEGELNHPPQNTFSGSTALAADYSRELGTRPFEYSPSTSRIDHRTGSPEMTRSRPRTSSSASAEDPEVNAKALKGELVPPTTRGSGGSGDDEVPPVPPLPPSVTLHNNIGLGRPSTMQSIDSTFAKSDISNGVGGGRNRPNSTNDADYGIRQDKSRGRGPLDLEKFLQKIEVKDSGRGGGVGRPPY
ncbi:hypothetical protein MMC20_003842 [Loxospora ochrophaea]|nr:hypothetical protein [Loxospora ochrophaea]